MNVAFDDGDKECLKLGNGIWRREDLNNVAATSSGPLVVLRILLEFRMPNMIGYRGWWPILEVNQSTDMKPRASSILF